MNKIKSLYNKNKVLFILTCIMIACTLVIIIGLLSSLFMGRGSSKYGNRLDKIKNIKISNNTKKLITSNYESVSNVKSSEIDIKGRIIYLTINVKDGTSINKSKSIALEGIKKFSNEELSAYDIQITIISDEDNAYPTMGYKNANSKSVSWINRT